MKQIKNANGNNRKLCVLVSDDKAKWHKLAAKIDKKARSTIILSLSDSVIREVAKEKTVAELWAKLENLYMTKSLANMLYIKKRMFSLKIVEGSSLEEHIDEFNKVCDTLETIDEGLNDKGKALLLITIVEDEGYESAGVCVATEDVQKMTGESSVPVKTNADNTRLWHLRLGHISLNGLKELEKQGVLGADKIEELDFYEDCVLRKSTRTSFKKSVHKTKSILDYVHSDLWGPSQLELPKGLWAETLLTACLLVNLSPSLALDFKTPHEKWCGKPTDYSKLKVFGCTDYAHANQGKLAPRALKGLFIGYPEGVKGYKIWCTDLSPHKCIVSRDVVFNEQLVLSKEKSVENAEPQSKTDDTIQFEVEHPANKTSSEAADSDEEIAGDVDTSSEHPRPYIEDYHLAKDRERRVIRPPERFGYGDLIAYALGTLREIDEEEPRSNKEAMQSSYKIDWQQLQNLGDSKLDDMLIACKLRDEIEELKKLLSSEFDMKDLGYARKILGMDIRRNKKECAKTDEEKNEMAKFPYANIVGCMMYAMVLTGPDISHALSIVSRNMATPVKEHWQESSGYYKAEYTAATEAVKEALWLKGMIEELGISQKTVEVHCDSLSAIYLSKNPAHHERTKHIDVKLHFIINEVSKGVIKIVKVHTNDNLADMLTKVVLKAKFKACLNMAGVCSL
ncbi:Integrase catalytic domain-containing protein [Citrus sinensis]|uniref:Integrase catalytic domain-containing protein n=1 Tax=Citrus sinensis TaxID=2711 RepID=A0ACB8KKG3_CITSI|nr:Integrase catalytic domain-containing protein [Citrus sinensis]